MKAEVYPNKLGGWKKGSILHRMRVWQQYWFSSFILYSLSFLLIVCFCFLGTVPIASAAQMPEIQRRGYFTIAVKDNLRPLGFRDAKGNLQGLEIDLAQRLASDLLGKANAVKLKPVANRDRLSVVFNNQVDFAIARVTATESRSRLVSFSVPYYFDGSYVVVKDTGMQRINDLAKRKIAVLNNSTTIADIKYYVPNAELVGVKSYEEAREKIESDAVSAFAADASVLSGWVQQYPQYRLLPTKLSTAPLSVVMPKGLQYDDLRLQVNGAIARYIDEGWLKQRAQDWGLP
ncbi:transporter substrate-binding domain-containing protein [Tolypothrix sp. LEGE 11397]|uniref:transporter substrate-binding domain-containing protein n=1 Tax=Tolypothrix sp. LEGE 11397 TaxID=2777971 RepID=UPI0005EAADD4|nr:bacterial extracellular solute-binding protein, family 3 [Tolypothrix sp. PCC 7601]MBE9085469.1 transporter substrate-binding domain-containing protein [Tolypothrix sp. LEGE 11397]UYD27221.1 transporter substrate-binding domain-containing protein [Tolypothrix sp. PCC 7712]UYD36919.1 transporter substrate-binding domain-containing protein [Tolypothrix sp. PCC 7601]BAY93369.1 glutamine ABC transporter, glutamine-binding protein GlnH [Microchaete diplosiphon NIES-3275]